MGDNKVKSPQDIINFDETTTLAMQIDMQLLAHRTTLLKGGIIQITFATKPQWEEAKELLSSQGWQTKYGTMRFSLIISF